MEDFINEAFYSDKYGRDVVYRMKINNYINASKYLESYGKTYEDLYEVDIFRDYIRYFAKTNFISERDVVIEPDVPKDSVYHGDYVCEKMFDMISLWLFSKDRFAETLNNLPMFWKVQQTPVYDDEIEACEEKDYTKVILKRIDDVNIRNKGCVDEILKRVDTINVHNKDNLSAMSETLLEKMKQIHDMVSDTHKRVGGYLDANGRPLMNYCSC